MRQHRITSVEVVHYPVLRVTFDDGLSGNYDLTESIDEGPIFTPLRDRAYFQSVAVAQHGHSFGWNLDDEGHEIDFCPESTRIHIETRIVEDLASRYAGRQSAAE